MQGINQGLWFGGVGGKYITSLSLLNIKQNNKGGLLMKVGGLCKSHLLEDLVNTSHSTFLLAGWFLLVIVNLERLQCYTTIIQA